MPGLPKVLEELPSIDTLDDDGACDRQRLQTLCGRLGYQFARPELLRVALTLGSWANEHPRCGWPSNAVLEFFGDAVLDLLAADRIWQRFPELAEGELTRLRASLVSEYALADAASALGLGEFLWLGRGDHKLGARAHQGILADAVEAILGAVFLDARCQQHSPLEAAALPFERLLGGRLAALDPSQAADPKSRLQHWAQATYRVTPSYAGEPGDPGGPRWLAHVELRFADGRVERLGTGSGPSLREAQRRAAQVALASIGAGDQ